MAAGYSGTPLAHKLGFKPGSSVALIGTPADYRKLLGRAAKTVTFLDSASDAAEFVHLFVTKRSDLERTIRHLRNKVADTAAIWVSWPKKSAGMPTDVSEDVIRAVALPLGFVDVKVCAVDETWSGLKLMIRRELRKPGTR
jgi:hypothetical protein